MAPRVRRKRAVTMLDFDMFNRTNLNATIIEAHSQRVSDVIIRSGRPILFKKFNQLVRINELQVSHNELLTTLQEIYQNSITSNLGRGRDAPFRYPIMLKDDSMIYCRCHITALGSNDLDYGAELTVRILNEYIPNVSEIGLPMELVDSLQREVGVMLVSGPTGSGKSTSIASALQHHVQHHHDNIITVEDPIEFNLEGIKNKVGDIAQSEVPKNIDSFSRAFKGSLRRAPDIIFWSEVRDSEAISNLITSALTGHYVLSTVHTNSTEQTLPRLIDAYPTEEQRSAAVRIYQAIDTIMHQRLILNLNGNGRTAVRSWCFFDAVAQEKLLNDINKPEKIGAIVREQMKNNGRLLADDLIEKFSGGLISLEGYINTIKTVGTPKDLKIIKTVGDQLVQRELLSQQDYKDGWLKYE